MALLAELGDPQFGFLAKPQAASQARARRGPTPDSTRFSAKSPSLKPGKARCAHLLDVLGREHTHLAVPRPRVGVAFDSVVGREAHRRLRQLLAALHGGGADGFNPAH